MESSPLSDAEILVNIFISNRYNMSVNKIKLKIKNNNLIDVTPHHTKTTPNKKEHKMSKNTTNEMTTKINASESIDELDLMYKAEQKRAHELKAKFDADLQKLYDDFRAAKMQIRKTKEDIWNRMKFIRSEKKVTKKPEAGEPTDAELKQIEAEAGVEVA